MPEVSRKMMGNKNALGKKYPPRSEEYKKKQREIKVKNPTMFWLGKKRDEETKRKISITKLMKSGRTEPKKKDERNDPLYKRWRRKVQKRDKAICRLQNENCMGYKVVHHILPWRDYPEERYNINNGITLCQYHHPKKREDERRLILTFQELVGSK